MGLFRSRAEKGVAQLVATTQPRLARPIVAITVVQPAGTVGRDARGEIGAGVSTLAMSAAGVEAEREYTPHAAGPLPYWTAIAVTDNSVHLFAAELGAGQWVVGDEVARWPRSAVRATVRKSGAMTRQASMQTPDGVVEFEIAKGSGGVNEELVALLAGE